MQNAVYGCALIDVVLDNLRKRILKFELGNSYMMQKHLLANQGQLLPMPIDKHDE